MLVRSPAGRSIGAVIPTFVPGCEVIPPRVRTVTTGDTRPARPLDAPVDVFLAGRTPPRRFVEIGTVEVTTGNRNTSLGNLLDSARREARRLGGDALVDVRPPTGFDPLPRTRVLTARVVSWV